MSEKVNIEILLDSIRQKAEKEKNEILAKAEEKSREINGKTDKQIDAIREQALMNLDQELKVTSTRIISESQQKKRIRLLEVKNRLFDKAFKEAEQKLSELVRAKVPVSVIKKLIREALGEIPDKAVVRISPEYEAAAKNLQSEIKNSFKIEVDRSSSGTISVGSSDGKTIIDNSFKQRLNKARAVMTKEIIEILLQNYE